MGTCLITNSGICRIPARRQGRHVTPNGRHVTSNGRHVTPNGCTLHHTTYMYSTCHTTIPQFCFKTGWLQNLPPVNTPLEQTIRRWAQKIWYIMLDTIRTDHPTMGTTKADHPPVGGSRKTKQLCFVKTNNLKLIHHFTRIHYIGLNLNQKCWSRIQE